MYDEIKNIPEHALLGDFNVQGLRFVVYDTYKTDIWCKSMLGYYLYNVDGTILFHDEDFHASPLHSVDSYETFASLLGFLTLKQGDTDREYFANYTEKQLEFANSSLCENIACDLCMLEENDSEEFNYEDFFVPWERENLFSFLFGKHLEN